MARRSMRRYGAGLLLLWGMLTLAACGVSTPSKITLGSPATPDAATIVKNVGKADVKDATFTLNATTTMQGANTTLSGTGKLTLNPTRTDIVLNTTIQQTAVTVEVITDGSTSYTKLSGIPGLPATWTKASTGASSSVDTSQFTKYGNLNNATLVGVETVNGTVVYHLKGESGGYQQDVYVRRDNYYPVKVVVHGTSSAAFDATIVFTAINTGITITPPPASEVKG